MFKVVATIAALIALCGASTVPYAAPEYDAPAVYSYDWTIKDDSTYNNFGQTETRNGDKTDGSYFVLLPDGRVQSIKYSVNGDGGYVAEVSYSGEPKYEASYKKSVYKPAPYPS